MKFTIRLIHCILWTAAAYKWGDWKNWRPYYPTMLFFGFGNLIYNLVFYNHLLWVFKDDLLVRPFPDLLVIFTIFASATLIFLSHYPHKLNKQLIYLGLWVALFTVIEIGMGLMDLIEYDNGWNIGWSIVHNGYQFPLLILHYKNPLLAWIMAFAILSLMMAIFDVPLILRP